MNPNDPLDDQAIHALMESLPMSTNTPETLKNKLVQMAAAPDSSRRAIRRPLFGLALGGATVVAAIALMTAVPSSAKSWDAIKTAVQAIQRMELTVTDLKEGEQISKVQINADSIYVRLPDGEFMYLTAGVVRTYDRSDNLALDVLIPRAEMAAEVRADVLKELSMSRLLADYEAAYGKGNIWIGASRLWNGRRVYDVTLTDPETLHFGKLVVDVATDFPVLLEAYEVENGKPVKRIEIAARYNAPASAEPELPKGARHETINLNDMIEKNGGKIPRLNFKFNRLLSR